MSIWPHIRQFLGNDPARHVLYLDRYVVPCPARGDIELEECFRCPLLRTVGGEPIDRIECEGRPPLPPKLAG